DLGLALSLEAQSHLREDLRLLVMSATLDSEPLARLLAEPPRLVAKGRSYAVRTQYWPRRADLTVEQQTAQVITRALAADEGDLLCFLPGAAEIRRVAKSLDERALSDHVRIMPLYGELDPGAQDAALAPAADGIRKVVLATSIAETSLTIEGVRIVVDSGLSRHAEFDPVSGMSRLATTRVSQASADQRRGRAGRLAPGVCHRLWSEGAHASLAAHTDPEIVRADLAPLALELALWGSDDAAELAWLDPPPAAHLDQARDLLRELEAIDAQGRITAHGREIAALGAHPRLGHMLLGAGALGASRLACDLAAILEERDLLRGSAGARDADVRLRCALLANSAAPMPAGLAVDGAALARARRQAGTWRRALGAPADTVDRDRCAGMLLALAYPDRIARARDERGRFLLANGRGARFAEPQALAGETYLVAASLDGAEREARIHLAAPVQHEQLQSAFAQRIEDRAEIVWDSRRQAVRARRERRLGAIVLESSEIADADPTRLAEAMLAGLAELGIGALPWTQELRQWQARVALLRRVAVAAPAPWPDLADATLASTLEEWASPWLQGCSRREHLARVDLTNALRGRLTHAQTVILNREAPTHLEVPSGSRIAIDYLDGEVPSVSVRLQEMFGLTSTPRIAAGRVALLIKLLSPAGRPVQVTSDLDSFWQRGYHEVRKDLKGRYPKHYWPEDPHTAEPTRRVRPR
ncbi:MAG: ATP-dependent helicase HrpB, partial [Gammaproteobacteria bacterium]|nr:ATP-dependent helicase HrpB [Gammaproteobacteria bacterium]